MNINLIINLVVYAVLFLGLLAGFFLGFKRGIRKSAIRLGTFVVFAIIAGFITAPISSALINLNISFLNLNISGTTAETIPHLIQIFTNSISGFQQVADAAPSITSFINQLPIAILNLIVFLILISLMQLISWAVYMIISTFALRESRIRRDQKKKEKLERKKKKIGQQEEAEKKKIVPLKPKALPLPPPKKYRLWGAAVGTLQSFIFLFLLSFPFTSLFGIINETIYNPSNIESSYSVYADNGEEVLYEFSYDLLENLIGDDIVSYFNTFNNSFPTKVLSLGGMNNIMFDSLTKTTVNNHDIFFRKEIVNGTKIYDNYILILDEMGNEENLSDFNFNIVRSLSDSVLDLGIVNAFGEEIILYAADQLYLLDEETLPSYAVEAINSLLALYKQDPQGLIPSLKKDFSHILNISEVALSSGLVDRFFVKPIFIDNVVDDIKNDDFKILTTFINEGYSSYIIRVATVEGLNFALNTGSSSLSSESFNADLGTSNYAKVNWETVKPSVYNLIKTLIDIYDIAGLYDVDALFENPAVLLNDLNNTDIEKLISLTGKEIDLIANSPLFEKDKNPILGFIDWLDNNEKTSKFIDASAMLKVSSWQHTLEPLTQSILGLKNSGALELVFEESLDIQELIDSLITPISSELNTETYVREILRPILNSSISKGFVVYLLNEVNSILVENIPSIELTNFSKESFPNNQNEDILNVMENVLKCFSIFDNKEEIDLSTVDTSKLAALLKSLQDNAFRKNTPNSVEYNVDFENKTVVDGGIFSNYYISFVTYIFGEIEDINYKNVDWNNFLKSSQELYSNFKDLEEGSIENLINLGEEGSKEELENLLESLGLDSSIAQDLVNINDAINSLNDPDSELSDDEIYDIIDEALTNLWDSQSEDGKKTIESLVDIVESVTGEQISEDISLSVIEKEKLVSNRLKLLILNTEENPIDASDMMPDTIHPELNLLDATIKDLTCGATYILQNSQKTIYLSSIDITTLTEKIQTATEDPVIRSLVSDMFVIVD